MVFRIKEKREALGLSQTELGKILRVSPQVVHNWESGTNPKAEMLPQLAKALKCKHIDDLYPEEVRP